MSASSRAAGWVACAVIGVCIAPRTCPAADVEQAQYNVVASLYNAGQWQAAINKINEREKLNLSPEMRAKYLYAKALAFEKGAKHAEARDAYTEILAKYPQSAEAQPAGIATIYLDYSQGRLDAAAAAYEKLDKSKLSAADRKNLALVYAEGLYARKDDKRALDAYQAAVSMGADPVSLAPKLFALRARLGQHAELLAQSVQAVPGIAADQLALVRAESFLALSKYAETDIEAQKVPDTSALYPRACFARAQALLKLGKLKDATAPLEVATEKLKDPPAPLSAYVALAECLLESGRGQEVEKVLAKVLALARGKPEAERKSLEDQVALLKVRAAGDPEKVADAVTELRDRLPAAELPKLLYSRLYAWSQQKRWQSIAASLNADLPVIQTTDEYGPAVLIYYAALEKVGKTEDAIRLLEALIARQPDTPDALRARVVLSSAALNKQDYTRALQFLDKAVTAPGAEQVLGKEAFQEACYNRALALERQSRHAEAAAVLTTLVAANPADELAVQALLLLGQAHAADKNWPPAISAWKQLLAKNSKGLKEADVRDRLARALFASGDAAGADEQYTAAAKLLGGAENLPVEGREAWARTKFKTGKFAEAAKLYEQLATSGKDIARLAYECAVAQEKAGDKRAALAWYTEAAGRKAQLPADYASQVSTHVARLQMENGAGDMGAAEWVETVVHGKDPAAFERAIAALRKIVAAGKLQQSAAAELKKLLETIPPSDARRYAIGGLLLEYVYGRGKNNKAAAKLSEQLATELAQNEQRLDPKSSGSTVGAAAIYFYRGESQRIAGLYAEGLASYETVLSAYPYNAWPDAAACRAAECYLALGDAETAAQKFKEVAQSTSNDTASAHWRKIAETRLSELQKRK